MNKGEMIITIKRFVYDTCKNDSSGHDWGHIERVYNNAMLINESEKTDEFIITVIALMHDLYDHKFFNGNVEEKLKETLENLHVNEILSKEEIQNIIHSCANIGFSSNITEKKELSHEGKIVQDADRLDAIGAIGIARTFAYGGKKGKVLYNPNKKESNNLNDYYTNGSETTIEHFYDKLLKLKDLMNTDTAKKIAIQRHEFMENFLKEFFDECNGLK